MTRSLFDDDCQCCCDKVGKQKPCHKKKSCKKHEPHKECHETKKHEKDCDNKKCHELKTCEQSLIEFIHEAAHIENALANAINAEVKLIREGHAKVDQLENLIKLAIKKEIVLEFLIEDIVKACEELKKCKKKK